MPGWDLVVGIVGKPSAGKSTFFNAATHTASAKTGNYPFTTIEPNTAIAHFSTTCPCKAANLQDRCKPRFGRCKDGVRFVPVKMLDVAGLVPGASEGAGLGNKFLDDLRHADALIHVVDVSGTTNEKGEATQGYDPINDIEWLESEIRDWIFGNLWTKWPSVTRRHKAAKATVEETFTQQFSGYGATRTVILDTIREAGNLDPHFDLESLDRDGVLNIVKSFVRVRFPTVYLLNKIDHEDADRNIDKICRKYGQECIVLGSGLAECFLQKMRRDGYILYDDGDEFFTTADDASEEDREKLRPLDDKVRGRLDNILDSIMFRFVVTMSEEYGGTGIQEAINRAVSSRNPLCVYPVRSVRTLSTHPSDPYEVLTDVVLVRPGTTAKDLARILLGDSAEKMRYVEGPDGRRIGEEDVLTSSTNVVRFVLSSDEA